MAIYRGAGGASDSVDDATVNAVAASAASAAASATAAAGSASSAAASAASASGSVSSVTTSASNAATSASQAETSASNASTSATSASNDAAAANASSVSASTSASNASNSASAAGISETNAASSASSASTSATNSANSAASALAIYGNTTAMNNAVAAASTSASNAATSASNAAASAATATTQATNASNSAVAANASKDTAVISSYNAGVSEYNASVFAANAATSATDSAAVYGGLSAVNAAVATTTTNANNASASATNASNSATQAAASAASASAIVLGVASGFPSIRPTLNLDFANSGVVDPRITFTRASTATYYDGKTTAKAEENLVPQSQEFDHAGWTKYQTTVTANSAAAPDGTTTADTITVTSTVGAVYRNVVSGGTQHTASCYFSSAGTAPFPALIIGNTSSIAVFAVFNLAGNVVSQTSATGAGTSIASTSITNVGGNWYRCSITFTLGNTVMNFLKLEFAPTATGNTVDSYGEIIGNTAGQFYYAWGAQLEQRSSVTAYTPTTTQAITKYVPVLQTAASGVPRLDYDPVTFAALGLLIEEQRTNSIRNNTGVGAVAGTPGTAPTNWSFTGPATGLTRTLSIGSEGGIAYLDVNYVGTASGSTFAFVNTESISGISAATGQTWNGSFYLKLVAGSTAGVDIKMSLLELNSGGSGVVQSLSPTLTPTDASLSTQRNTLTATLSGGATVTNLQQGLRLSFTNGPINITLRIGLPQLELGAFATSVIPTTAAAATRAADNAIITGTNFSSWYNAKESTLYSEWSNIAAVMPTGGAQVIASFNDTTANNNQNLFQVQAISAKASQNTISRAVNPGRIDSGGAYSNQPVKAAAAFAASDRAISVNGLAATTSTSGALPALITRLELGSNNGITYLNGQIRSIVYYPKRLTNTELQALTA